MPIIAPIPRDERRLIQKTIHKTRDKDHARRLTAMLMLHRGDKVSDVAQGVAIRFIDDGICTDGDMGKMVVTILG